MLLTKRVRFDVGSVVFWGIAFVPVTVFLLTPRVVLQDGGLHLSNAVALRGLIEGWFPSLLSWRAVLSPNMTVEIVLAALTTVFSADIALRLVSVVGLVGFAVAVAALVRAAGLPVYAGIPLLAFEMHYFMMLGFLGFVWAVPLALGAVALVVRQPLDPPKRPLLLLLVTTWFTHLVPAIAAAIAVTAIVLFAHLANDERPASAAFSTLRVLAVPITTTALLTVVFLVQTRTSVSYGAHSPAAAAKALVQFRTPLVAYSGVERWAARVLAAAVYAVALGVIAHRVRGRSHLKPLDGVLAASALIALFAVVVPEQTTSGAGYVGMRLTLFATLFMVFWVCIQLPSLQGRTRTLGRAMIVVAAVVAVVLPIARVPALRHLAGRAEQIDGLAACLPVRSTLIQLNLDLDPPGDEGRLVPMAEQTGTIAVSRESLDLGNESGWFPFYIWRYTDGARADFYIEPGRHFDEVPPPVDLAAAMRAGLPLKGVFVYGRATAPASVLAAPSVQALDEDLAANFRLVRTSSEGDAELWLRKGVAATC